MENSFLDYAMSVIMARALPDVRDGLKPVHRRIIWDMEQQGFRPDRPSSSAPASRGDTMARFHPHGDSAIYDALVRMAQPFSLRHPLIDFHGNYGSPDFGPAASRYCRHRRHVGPATRWFERADRPARRPQRRTPSATSISRCSTRTARRSTSAKPSTRACIRPSGSRTRAGFSVARQPQPPRPVPRADRRRPDLPVVAARRDHARHRCVRCPQRRGPTCVPTAQESLVGNAVPGVGQRRLRLARSCRLQQHRQGILRPSAVRATTRSLADLATSASARPVSTASGSTSSMSRT